MLLRLCWRMKVRVESAPPPGEHGASPLPWYGLGSRGEHGPRHRASTRHRPYHGTASQAVACMVAKERFFPFTRKFHSMCHSPAESYYECFVFVYSIVVGKGSRFPCPCSFL